MVLGTEAIECHASHANAINTDSGVAIDFVAQSSKRDGLRVFARQNYDAVVIVIASFDY